MASAGSSNNIAREGHSRTQVRSTKPPTSTQQQSIQPVLRLRGVNPSEEQGVRGAEHITHSGGSEKRIQWAEDVVDNEGLGRKSSKVCCIYHAPRPIDESSDESSSDSSSDGSDDGDDGAARPTSNNTRRDCELEDHNHNHVHTHKSRNSKRKGKERKRSPNAYERQPNARPKDGESSCRG